MSGRETPHADTVFSVAAREPVPGPGDATAAVDTSWRRCLNEFKLDPVRTDRPLILDAAKLRDLQCEHAELVEIAQAEMDSLYEAIAGSGYALLLADTHGFILCEKMDPTLKQGFNRAGLMVGAEWSEQREGTNGIGTCATERRPITIHQTDHFMARHVGLSCSAAPIYDPHGNVIAVLDASSVSSLGSRESQTHTVALVNASARLIEKCLFLRRYRADAVLRFHYRPEFVDLLHDGAIAIGSDGTIVAADMPGLRLLGAKHRGELIGRPFADVFDASAEELLSAANTGRRAIWELRDLVHGNRYYASFAAVSASRPRPQVARTSSPRTLIAVGSDPPGQSMTLESLAGEDPQMMRNLYNARRVLDSAVSVLICGPTGSGKEAFAKAMHLASQRAKQPFIAVNCAAIPEPLIESELFGYGAGAFTGARREGMRGRLLQSSGGTLFLDEIGDMPLALQTRLLRVIEEHEVTPLGCDAPVKVNLRVISASHRHLRDMVAEGLFRDDLFYRLNGITLDMPALGQRRDKEALVRRCIARESAGAEPVTVELGALERLTAYPWPGNIRELRNALRTALAICEGRLIRLSDLPREIREFEPAAAGGAGAGIPSPSGAPRPLPSGNALESAERRALLEAIELHHWNLSHVAAHLRMSRNTLYRKLRRHGIAVGPARARAH